MPAALALASPTPTDRTPAWAADLHRWAQWMEVTGHSPLTIRSYRNSLIRFTADTLLDLTEVTEDDVVRYQAALPANGARRDDMLRALRSFYAWRDDGASPVRRLKPRPSKLRDAPSLTDDEVVRLLVALAWREPRRAWTFLLLLATGARITSACSLEPGDLRRDRINFRVTKNDKPYGLPAPPGSAARTAFDELARTARPGGTLIGAGPERVRQWFRLAETEAEVGKRIHSHLLRHTFATIMSTATDPGTWRVLMNHSDLSQYARYVHPDEDRMRAAMAAVR